jgi:hypothetical protein
VVKYPEPEMRHPDLIGVGKKETDLGPHLRKIFMDAVDLGVDISRGFRNQRQEIFEHGTPLKRREHGA